MYSFYKRLLFFAAILFIFLPKFGYSEWSYDPQVYFLITPQVDNQEYTNQRVEKAFYHQGVRGNSTDHKSSIYYKNYKAPTAQDFQYHFDRMGYTETEILNQRCLYMFDGFVQYAKTYSDYKDTIQKLHAELKNINLIQKAYRAAKGMYCRGLQDRIAYLYKQLNHVKTIQQDNIVYKEPTSDKSSFTTKAANLDRTAFSEQFAEYKLLEPIYDAYVPCLAKAINARSDIYRSITDRGSVLTSINRSYNLNRNVKELLSHYGHELVPFTECSGNQLQQVIHQESLDILDRIDTLTHNSLLYDHQEALVDFTVAMVDYNHAGLTDKAMTIGDLCWTLLDYGKQ